MTSDQNKPKKATIDESLSCDKFLQASQRAANRLERVRKANLAHDSGTGFGTFIDDPRRSCDYDLEHSDRWNATKLFTYVNTLCQVHGIKNWNIQDTTGQRRAIKENKELCVRLCSDLGCSMKDLMLFYAWWFKNWSLFCGMFSKADELGYCPPFWIKALPVVKKFRDLYYNHAQKPLDSTDLGDDGFILE